MPSVPRIVGALAIAAVAILAVSGSATSASLASPAPFHLTLVRAEPMVNDTVRVSPKQLKLWFSESIELKGTSVRLLNSRREAVTLGKLSVDTAALAPAVVVVPRTLAPGKYTVSWRASDDGHPSSGKFAFVVK